MYNNHYPIMSTAIPQSDPFPTSSPLRWPWRLPKSEVIDTILELRNILRQMHVSLKLFAFAIAWSLFAQYFNLIVLNSVMDLSNGIIKGNFEFVRHYKGCKWVVAQWPNLFQSSASLFYLLLAMTFSSSLAKNAVSYLSNLTMTRMMSLASRRTRSLLFDRYMSFGKLYFDQVGIARVNHVLMNFSGAMTSQIKYLHGTIAQIFLFFTYLWMMCKISAPLTLLIFSMMIILLTFSRRWMGKVGDASEIIADRQIAATQNIFNLLNCIPLVKSYAQESDEKERFRVMNESEADFQYQVAKRSFLTKPIEELTVMTALMMVAATIGYLSSHSNLFRVGDIFVFFYLVRNSIPALNSVTSYKRTVASARGPLKALQDVLSDKDKPYVISGDRHFDGLQSAIELRDLKFAYGPKAPMVLDGVSFQLIKGKTTALVGKTGAGKSTIAHLLMRFYDCPEGSIFVDGIDIREFTPKSFLSRVAFVGQEPQLLNDTILQNLIYGLNRTPSGDEIRDVLIAAGLEGFVEKLKDGLTTRVGDRGILLSGGERQRLSIARAFLKNAEILVLDEATSALDSKTEGQVQASLDRLMKGRTVLVIAHRLSTIRLADHIVVLSSGRVSEQGTFDELLNLRGRFCEFWTAQHTSQAAVTESLTPGQA